MPAGGVLTGSVKLQDLAAADTYQLLVRDSEGNPVPGELLERIGGFDFAWKPEFPLIAGETYWINSSASENASDFIVYAEPAEVPAPYVPNLDLRVTYSHTGMHHSCIAPSSSCGGYGYVAHGESELVATPHLTAHIDRGTDEHEANQYAFRARFSTDSMDHQSDWRAVSSISQALPNEGEFCISISTRHLITGATASVHDECYLASDLLPVEGEEAYLHDRINDIRRCTEVQPEDFQQWCDAFLPERRERSCEGADVASGCQTALAACRRLEGANGLGGSPTDHEEPSPDFAPPSPEENEEPGSSSEGGGCQMAEKQRGTPWNGLMLLVLAPFLQFYRRRFAQVLLRGDRVAR